MSDTLENITLTANTWTDLYDVSGIAVGTKIIIQAIGANDIFLTSQAAQPTDESSTQIVRRGEWVINDAGDLGAWAFCSSNGARLNVRVA